MGTRKWSYWHLPPRQIAGQDGERNGLNVSFGGEAVGSVWVVGKPILDSGSQKRGELCAVGFHEDTIQKHDQFAGLFAHLRSERFGVRAL